MHVGQQGLYRQRSHLVSQIAEVCQDRPTYESMFGSSLFKTARFLAPSFNMHNHRSSNGCRVYTEENSLVFVPFCSKSSFV